MRTIVVGGDLTNQIYKGFKGAAGDEWINLTTAHGSNDTSFQTMQEYMTRPSVSNFDGATRVIWGVSSVLKQRAYNDLYGKKTDFNAVPRNTAPEMAELVDPLYYYHMNLDVEIMELGQKIRFWDKFFTIKRWHVFWFDEINTHQYLQCSKRALQQDYEVMKGSSWPRLADLTGDSFTDKYKWGDIIEEAEELGYVTTFRNIENYLFDKDIVSELCMLKEPPIYYFVDRPRDTERVNTLMKLGYMNEDWRLTDEGRAAFRHLIEETYIDRIMNL